MSDDDEVQIELIPAGTTCDGCGTPIVEGQHYLRLAVLFDTAGMDSVRIFDVPTVSWTRIYDDPVCAGLDLALAGRRNELFTDVFGR